MTDRASNSNERSAARKRLRAPHHTGQPVAYDSNGEPLLWRGDVDSAFVKTPPFPEKLYGYGEAPLVLSDTGDTLPILDVRNYRTLLLEIDFTPGSNTSVLTLVQITGTDPNNMSPDMLVDNAITYGSVGSTLGGQPISSTPSAQRDIAMMSFTTRSGSTANIFGKLAFDVSPYTVWRLNVRESGDAANPGTINRLRYARSW